MKVLILYRPTSEHSRRVEEFNHDIIRQHNIEPDMMSLDTREGAALASLYDVMSYPSIMVTRDDGQLVKDWTGDQLPLMNEVAAYLRS